MLQLSYSQLSDEHAGFGQNHLIYCILTIIAKSFNTFVRLASCYLNNVTYDVIVFDVLIKVEAPPDGRDVAKL
jgi:hypothetical protein